MNAVIAIDNYKRFLFCKRLDEAGFEYTVNPGLTSGTLLLSVEVEDERVAECSKLIKKINAEARRRRHN